MTVRRAQEKDIPGILAIYEAILEKEERGELLVGWARGVYPTERTAREAFEKGTLFVGEQEGRLVAAAKIDQEQVPEYRECPWELLAEDQQIMVLHTLVVSPEYTRKGCGRAFVAFYEKYAEEVGCRNLRLDTNEKNAAARSMYRKLGYREAGIVPCVFNGIPGVRLVCFEKKL